MRRRYGPTIAPAVRKTSSTVSSPMLPTRWTWVGVYVIVWISFSVTRHYFPLIPARAGIQLDAPLRGHERNLRARHATFTAAEIWISSASCAFVSAVGGVLQRDGVRHDRVERRRSCRDRPRASGRNRRACAWPSRSVMPSHSAVDLERRGIGVHPVDGFAIGFHEAVDHGLAVLQGLHVGDQQAHRLALERRGVVAGRDDADLPSGRADRGRTAAPTSRRRSAPTSPASASAAGRRSRSASP